MLFSNRLNVISISEWWISDEGLAICRAMSKQMWMKVRRRSKPIQKTNQIRKFSLLRSLLCMVNLLFGWILEGESNDTWHGIEQLPLYTKFQHQEMQTKQWATEPGVLLNCHRLRLINWPALKPKPSRQRRKQQLPNLTMNTFKIQKWRTGKKEEFLRWIAGKSKSLWLKTKWHAEVPMLNRDRTPAEKNGALMEDQLN